MQTFGDAFWESVFRLLRSSVHGNSLPSVSEIARRTPDPFRVLISTMISLRTKDEVTLAASERLFARAATPEAVAAMAESSIASLIYPAGFYRTKAASIRNTSRIICDRFAGAVPASVEELTSLPGVGRKTANLVLNLGFGLPAICVDTHVHRISNRFGWVATKTPDRTELALAEILPQRYWIEINELLVGFGQTICVPVSPRCSSCPFSGTGGDESVAVDRVSGDPDAEMASASARPLCKRVGVTRSR